MRVNNIKLFFSFFRIGIFTFGGGLAMLPLLEKEMKKYGLSEDEVWDFFSLGQTLPGVIAINSATLVGHHVGNFWGAFWATLGVIMPSLIIIIAITLSLEQYMSNALVQSAFSGIRLAAAVLIFGSASKLLSHTLIYLNKQARVRLSLPACLVFLLTLLLLALNVNPFYIIVLNIVGALLLFYFDRKRKNL